MNVAHHLSRMPRHFLAFLALSVLALGGAIAAIAASGDAGNGTGWAGTSVHLADDAGADAQEPAGVTAEIEFTNNLLDGSNLEGPGTSPLLMGAEGQVWATGDGRLRMDLSSAEGDVRALLDDHGLTVHDESSNTVYEARATTLRPDQSGPPAAAAAGIHGLMDKLMRYVELSSVEQDIIAGRPAQAIRVSPRRDGGLLSAVELAWDAEQGVPLRAAVHAQGQDEPVLALEATDVQFGPVSDADLELQVPADARVVEIEAAEDGPAGPDASGAQRSARGLRAVQDEVPFEISAPNELAGLSRTTVVHVRLAGRSGALITYGPGLGGISVLQMPTDAADPSLHHDDGLSLPELSIGGTTGRELATPLGTLITFERGAVAYTVAGLVPAAAAEAAARRL